MFRTADAAGIEKVYLGGITPDPLDRLGRPRQQFVKVSLGAEKTVAWEKAGSVVRLISKLKKEGFTIIAVEQAKNSIPYDKLDIKGKESKIAFIFGNEVDGVSKSVLSKCDVIAEIPMAGTKESLNVAVTFGIIVFHFLSHS